MTKHRGHTFIISFQFCEGCLGLLCGFAVEVSRTLSSISAENLFFFLQSGAPLNYGLVTDRVTVRLWVSSHLRFQLVRCAVMGKLYTVFVPFYLFIYFCTVKLSAHSQDGHYLLLHGLLPKNLPVVVLKRLILGPFKFKELLVRKRVFNVK